MNNDTQQTQTPEDAKTQAWMLRQLADMIRSVCGPLHREELEFIGELDLSAQITDVVIAAGGVANAMLQWQNVTKYSKQDFEERAKIRATCARLAGVAMMIAFFRGGMGDPEYDSRTMAHDDLVLTEARQFIDLVASMRDAQNEYFKGRSKDQLIAAKTLESHVDYHIRRIREIQIFDDGLPYYNPNPPAAEE